MLINGEPINKTEENFKFLKDNNDRWMWNMITPVKRAE